jgi:hypothetical protein
MDASALSDRVTILSFSVVYRGCAMQGAWTITAGGEKGAWRPHWQRMLQVLAEAVPADWTVYVMADRGLSAAWLFRAMQANGWHPSPRVKKGLGFRAQGEAVFGQVGERVKRPGQEWKGQGAWNEQGERLEGTLVVRWEQGEEEPIAGVTDLAPNESRTAWYQLRFWIECEDKDGKRGWFHWEQTTMHSPQRASRVWLVFAVVMHKAILLGGELEAQEEKARQRRRSHQRGKRRPGQPPARRTQPRGREQSVLLRGVMALRAAETGSFKAWPTVWVRPEPLPTRLSPVSRVPKNSHLRTQRRSTQRRARTKEQRKRKRAEREQRRAEREAARRARSRLRDEKEAGIQARKRGDWPKGYRFRTSGKRNSPTALCPPRSSPGHEQPGT